MGLEQVANIKARFHMKSCMPHVIYGRGPSFL